MFRRLGFDLIRRHYYSPIPDLEALPPETWTEPVDMPGLDFDVGSMWEFVSGELRPFVKEWDPAGSPTGTGGFHLDNGYYESVDAELLYAMIRRFRPSRVVELGSGMSTLVIAEARAANGGDRSGHRVFEPHPRPDLADAIERVATAHPVSANDVPMSEFEALGPGDVLFVDTTHTVKVGSEVNRVILEMLPRLAPGVLVHIHDIYLPFEYPREFLADRNFFWAEQYLLQAFLTLNPQFEVLLGAHALARLRPDEIAGLIPSARTGIEPSAFWIRRTEPE